MTQFLRYLGDEVPCNFLVHGVKDVSRWCHALKELNITHITEVDCKDQVEEVLRFEMTDNIYLRACGKVTHCIPMGG